MLYNLLSIVIGILAALFMSDRVLERKKRMWISEALHTQGITRAEWEQENQEVRDDVDKLWDLVVAIQDAQEINQGKVKTSAH